MIKINRLFSLFFLYFLLVPDTFSYELSQEKKDQLNHIKFYLNSDIENRDLDFYQEKLDKINLILPKNRDNIQKWQYLNQIKLILEEIIKNNYVQIEENIELNLNNKKDIDFIIENYKNFELEFLKKYWNDILWWDILDKCMQHYDYIDVISKQNNFPTPLVIATWRIEGGCNLSNPNNWWWPFQITSQYYKPWKVTLDDFWKSVVNFINFSKNKWSKYEKNKNLKQKFTQEKINITYENYTIEDIRIHSALYNWLKNKSSLENSLFINWNFNSKLVSKYDWILTLFIKVLKYKQKNSN